MCIEQWALTVIKLLSRSIGRQVMVFPIFCNMAAVRHFEFWKIIFDQVTVIAVLICCRIYFIKIASRIRPPDAHYCWMYNALLLSNGRCHGNRIMRDMSGTWGMRPPRFHPNRSIGRRVIAFPTFCNMAAVRHLEWEFCYFGPPTKSTVRFDYPVKIWCRCDIPRLRYCDFIIVPVWLENASPRLLFGGIWGVWTP